jgi:hypothetical protein
MMQFSHVVLTYDLEIRIFDKLHSKFDLKLKNVPKHWLFGLVMFRLLLFLFIFVFTTILAVLYYII